MLFRGEAMMDVTGCCIFFDQDNNKLDRQNVKIGVRRSILPPSGAAYVKLSYRVCGPGKVIIIPIL